MAGKSVRARTRRWKRRRIAPIQAPGERLLFRLGQRLVRGQITIEEYRALARVAKRLAVVSRVAAVEPTTTGHERPRHGAGLQERILGGVRALVSGYAHPDVIVKTDWVAEHLNDPNVRIVEVDEFPERYGEGHIPGAVSFNWWEDLEDPVVRDVVTGEAFVRRLGEAGIGDETTVVLYGDKNNWFATYAYWLFKYNGHKQLKVMNGGRDKYIAEGRPLSTDVPRYPPRTHAVHPTDESIRAYRDQVLQRVREGSAALIDVRSPKEYSGELMAMEGYEQEGAQRKGHIAGALSIPWGQAVRADGTFKSAEELRALYGGRGVTPDREVIAYCRIGERSSHTWFVLTELLGYPNVRNYDGSWTEYGSIVGAPIEKSV